MTPRWPSEDDAVTPGWEFVSIGLEGDPVDLGSGVSPWPYSDRWVATGDRIVVAHPSYPRQRHDMLVYTLAATNPEVRFAAGEFSNGVWGFYVPRLGGRSSLGARG
jgi:hypothetical protein